MSQNYVEIPSSKKISESLADILGNDKTVMSCNEGTTFPSTNLYKGMLCLRSDQMKLYQLTNVSNKTQVCIADLNGVARHLDGGYGNCIPYDKKDLNDWNAMQTGFYQGSNMLNAPEGDTIWRVLMVRYGETNIIGNAHQIAFSHSTDKVMLRQQSGGTWSSQRQIVTAEPSSDGNTAKGLSADKVDGYDAGNKSGQVPVNNGILNENLNAQYLNGKALGNGSNNVPISNGNVCVNLNAQKLNGYTVGNGSGQIPLANGYVCAGLNAQMVGGISAEQIMKIDGNSSPTQSYNDMTVQTLRVTNLPNTRYYNGSGQSQSQTVTGYKAGTINSYTDDGSRGDYGPHYRYFYYTNTGVGAGNYSIFQLLQELVNRSHTHTIERQTYRTNCRCDCNCNCSDGD